MCVVPLFFFHTNERAISHLFYVDGLPHPPALPPSALCPPRPKLSNSNASSPGAADPFLRAAAAAAEGASPLRFPLGPGSPLGGLPQAGPGGAIGGLELAGLDPVALQRRLAEQRMGMAALAAAASGGQQQQNVYELAALTQDMDTLQVTTRIRELLSSNNLCQKVRREKCTEKKPIL